MRKSELGPFCQRLVDLMQEAQHARIEGLRVQNGRPVFKPPPRIIRKVRMQRRRGLRSEATPEDFELKEAMVAFFEYLAYLNNGVVRSVEVQDGLPLSMEVETEPGL